KKNTRLYLALLAATTIAVVSTAAPAEDRTLASVHADVKDRFQTVKHLQAQDLKAFDADDIIIFDVREKGEFAVSHLSNAIRIDPDTRPAEFMRKHADRIAGKTILVYCSVGVRSSALAARLARVLKREGDTKIYNLTGGIFQWHNEGRPLTRGDESTRFVHPYNRSWGQLLSNRELISYTPKP
ncbi:MAG: rhodanese-like domain-containing protein, partial [Pseudomonadota bacterium]